MEDTYQDASPHSPRELASLRTLDVELLFRLEMTARQVRGLFAHPGWAGQEAQSSEWVVDEVWTGPAWGGQLLKDAVEVIQNSFEEVARAPIFGPASKATALERESLLRARLLAYPAGRAIFMPSGLKDGEERFFTIVVGYIARHQISVKEDVFVANWLLQHPEQLQQLFELVRRSQSAGMDPTVVADAFLGPFLQRHRHVVVASTRGDSGTSVGRFPCPQQSAGFAIPCRALCRPGERKRHQ